MARIKDSVSQDKANHSRINAPVKLVDRVDSMARRTKNGRNAKLVGDLCDFCKKGIKISRLGLQLRRRKYRFACWVCKKSLGLDLKRDRIWMEHNGALAKKLKAKNG